MTSAPVQGISCTSCGGPLTPEGNQVRVTCPYCKAVNEIASAGAVKVAKQLDALGIRVPERPRTLDQIHEEISERQRAEATARRHHVTVALVMLGVVGVLVAVLALAL
ncbi:MAG: hypothetical protein R3B07_11690 [Polyangiaceae bacterium]